MSHWSYILNMSYLSNHVMILSQSQVTDSHLKSRTSLSPLMWLFFFICSWWSARFSSFSQTLIKSRAQSDSWMMNLHGPALKCLPAAQLTLVSERPPLRFFAVSSELVVSALPGVVMSTTGWQVVTQGLSAGWAWSARTPRTSRASRSPWEPRPERSEWSTCESSLKGTISHPSDALQSIELKIVMPPWIQYLQTPCQH